MRDQAPPIYPPSNDNVLVKGAENFKTLLTVDSPTWSHFHHIRCKEDTIDSVAERCRNLLDAEKGIHQLLHFFCFKSDDVRCDSLQSMLCAMLAHTGYNRMATYLWQDSIGAIGSG